MIKFTRDSENNLEEIADWIAEDNIVCAISFVQELRKKCIDLEHMPMRFPLIDFPFNKSVRKRAFKDYLIIYEVNMDDIIILHILHASKNYIEIFQ